MHVGSRCKASDRQLLERPGYIEVRHELPIDDGIVGSFVELPVRKGQGAAGPEFILFEDPPDTQKKRLNSEKAE